MAKQLVASVHARLKTAACEFVEQQQDPRKTNDQTSLIARAAARLGKGWSESSLKTAMGLKARRNPGQLPQSAALLRFCAVADVSTEWLLANRGPRRHSALSAGARLTTEELAAELSAYMLSQCASVLREPMRCDPGTLLAAITEHVIETASVDAAELEAWRLKSRASARTLSALMMDPETEAERADQQTKLVEALYALQRVVSAQAPPLRLGFAAQTLLSDQND